MNENDKDEDGGYFSNIDDYSGVIFFTCFPGNKHNSSMITKAVFISKCNRCFVFCEWG